MNYKVRYMDCFYQSSAVLRAMPEHQDRRVEQLTRSSPRSSSPTRRLASWHSRKSTAPVVCSGANSRWFRATDGGTPATRCGLRRADLARAGDGADGDFRLERRAGGWRISRSSASWCFMRRSPSPTDRVGKRQPLHFPPAAFDLTCRSRCWCPKPLAEQKRWAIVVPNYEYGSRPPPRSGSC